MKKIMENKCLYCYQPLLNNENDFHTACCKKMFGTSIPPTIDFGINEINDLAIKVLGKSISVTGVQPKLSVDFEKNKKQRLTIVGLFGNYILKPPFEEYSQMPEIEDLTMHLAEIVKIKTAQHTLIKLKSGELSYISKRFDRNKGQKLHQEDMAQLTGMLTEQKYRGSMEIVAKTIQVYSDFPGNDIIKLFEIMLFSYLTGNADMHLKNFSLLRDTDNDILLSPAYDLLSTKLLIHGDMEELALTLNGRKSKLRKKDFDYFANKFSINVRTLNSIYLRFQRDLPKIQQFISISFLSEDMKEKYLQLLSDRYKILFE